MITRRAGRPGGPTFLRLCFPSGVVLMMMMMMMIDFISVSGLLAGHVQPTSFKFQVSSLLRKIEKIQNMMYHCSQLAIAIRGEQWLDTK